MPTLRRNIVSIENDLCSDDQGQRLRASQELLEWVRDDFAIHARAAVAFREVIGRRQDAPTVNNATRGIELIEGPDAAWDVRTATLRDPRPDFVRGVAVSIADPRYAPPLLELLERHPDAAVRSTVVRVLGRMRVPAAFEAIVRCLDHPDVRPDAVDALAEFGDTRAVAHLRPLLGDATPAWEEDNHGPMLRVCDLAERAIARLSSRPTTAEVTSALPKVDTFVATATAAVAPPHTSLWIRLLCYVPLAMVVFEVPWCILVLMSQMGYKPGGFPREAQRAVTAVAGLPAAAGLVVGFYALVHQSSARRVDTVFLIIGLFICAMLAAAFGLSILK